MADAEGPAAEAAPPVPVAAAPVVTAEGVKTPLDLSRHDWAAEEASPAERGASGLTVALPAKLNKKRATSRVSKGRKWA